MPEILKLTVVDDISLICDLNPRESPLHIETLYSRDVPGGDLDSWAQKLVDPLAHSLPCVMDNKTGEVRLIEESDGAIYESYLHAEYIQETKIVMAHIYEEV